jgi:predicted YcjX-like family ATPase
MIAAVRSASRLAADVLKFRGTTRVGITGLARAGKTALLTSLAAKPARLISWPPGFASGV